MQVETSPTTAAGGAQGGGAHAPARVQLDWHGDGTGVGHYTFGDQDATSFSVRVGGQHVAGSPFAWTRQLLGTFCHVSASQGPTISNEGRRATGTCNSNWKYAIMAPGFTAGVHQWRVVVHTTAGYTMVGVIGTTSPGMDRSFNHATNYCWRTYEGGTWTAGQYTDQANGTGAKWQDGDEVALQLDVGARTLTLKHKRLQKVCTLSSLAAGTREWFIHLNVHGTASAEVFPLTPAAWASFL